MFVEKCFVTNWTPVRLNPISIWFYTLRIGLKFIIKSGFTNTTFEWPFLLKCPFCEHKTAQKAEYPGFSHSWEKVSTQKVIWLGMNWILAKSEKPYSWGHCDEKFNQKQNLNQHEMVQTGEKTLFMQVLLSEIQAVKRTWIDTAWFKDTIPMQVLSLWFKVKSHLTTDKSCCFDPWRERAIQYNGK